MNIGTHRRLVEAVETDDLEALRELVVELELAGDVRGAGVVEGLLADRSPLEGCSPAWGVVLEAEVVA